METFWHHRKRLLSAAPLLCLCFVAACASQPPAAPTATPRPLPTATAAPFDLLVLYTSNTEGVVETTLGPGGC